MSIPFTKSSSQNRNNPSEASSATPLPKPIVESPPGGYDADTEYSRSEVGEYREKCLVEQGFHMMKIECGQPQPGWCTRWVNTKPVP